MAEPVHRTLPWIALAFGVLIVSTAAVMIAAAIDLGVPTITIAAGRLAFAAALLTPIAFARSRREIAALQRREWLWGILAGVALAVHFASWISSLEYTSVASSTALVTTNPIFVVLASWLIFRERAGMGTLVGVLLTIAGSAVIAFSDTRGGAGSDPLLGDALALAGALAVSTYFLVGRSLRHRLSLLPYIWLVYSTAAVILLLWMFAAGHTLFGLSPTVYLLLLGLAIGPQLLGHTAFNWSLRHLSATVVTVGILGEPIGSALLALAVLGQPMQTLQLIGGAVLLAGIAVATTAERRTRQRALVEMNEGVVDPAAGSAAEEER